MNYRTIKYLPLATVATTVVPLVARAATPGVTPGVGGNTTLTPAASDSGAKFSGLVDTILTIVLWIASIAAILYLLLSGFNYITAGGDQEKADTARKGIINAVIGIIIIMAAYFIYNAASGAGGSVVTGDTANL